MADFQDRRIAYIARELPALSETFVVREASALLKLGVPLQLMSVYPPDPGLVHPELPDAVSRSLTVYRPGSTEFWRAHADRLSRDPGHYGECIRKFVLDPREPGSRRCRSFFHFLMAPCAANLLEAGGIWHIHAHFANVAASVAMMAAHLAEISFSFTAHAYDIFIDDVLMEQKLERASFVATCSQFNVDYLRERYKTGKAARIRVIPYGIDPSRFPFGPPRDPSCGSILGVGRLVETKGFHTLIQACEILKGRGTPFSCTLVGGGVEEVPLKTMAAAKGIADRVRFTGALPPNRVIEYYGKADVFVMPSCVRHNDRDGMPNVLLEAMASGLPVVATRVSGIPELVRDGETGLLVDPDNPAALADAVERLIVDQTLSRRLSLAARELVEREHDIGKSARRLAEFFAVLAGPSVQSE